MTTTKKFEEPEVEAAIERERHEPRYPLGRVATKEVLEVTELSQQYFDGVVYG